jgi:hypothetical protein
MVIKTGTVPVPDATAPGMAQKSILLEKLYSGEGPGVGQANNVVAGN